MKEDLETKLVKALIEFIRRSRGRRITLKANTLIKIARLDHEHTNILKAAKILGILVKVRLLKIEISKRLSRAKILRYIIDDSMDLWRYAKLNPEKTIERIMRILKSLERSLSKEFSVYSNTNRKRFRTINNPSTTLKTPKRGSDY